jgi:hypothetical protein
MEQPERADRIPSTSSKWSRALFGFACLVLLTWLALQTSPTLHRRTDINKLLDEGKIGQLTSGQADWLQGTVEWMASAAGVREPVVLNARFQPGRLHVFTTTPDSRAITHCDLGNAVYDAQLDAVFLDRSLFDSREFETFLSSTAYGSLTSVNDLPFVQTYVRFLLLHELGHRALHRNRGGVFDFGSANRANQEREADAFALAHLEAAYALPQALTNKVGSAGADLLDLDFNRLSAPERTLADLAGMATGMNLSLLFISNPYAPFYQDSAHATFLSRSLGLLEAARQRQTSDPVLTASLDAVEEMLRREESALSNPLVEIIAPDPIADVSFDKQGLLITSVGLTKLFEIERSSLEDFHASAGPASRFRSIWAGVGTPARESIDDWWKVGLWSSPDGGFAWGRDGRIWKANKQGWSELDTPGWRPLARHSSLHLYTPPQPAIHALAESDDSFGHPWLSSLIPNRVLASRAEGELNAEIQGNGGPRGSSLSVIGLSELTAFLAIQSPDKSYWGVSELDLTTMRPRSLTKLQFPHLADQSESQVAIAVSPLPVPRYFLISSNGIEDTTAEFVVWELSATNQPTVLVRHPYFHSKAASLQHAFGGQSIASVDWMEDRKILLGIGNDSLYLVNLETHTVAPIFHPGDEIIKKRIGHNGMIAVFVQGGYKCYVMRR